MENTRRLAALVYRKWLLSGGEIQSMLPDGEGRQFVQDIVYTAVRRRRAIRFALDMFVKQWPKGELESLLVVGAAQILYMESVPDFAAVSETVEAAKRCENPSVAKVVNGVLRNLIRRRAEVESSLAAAPLAVRESFPDALVKRWERDFGPENAAAVCIAFNRPADNFIAAKDGTFRKLEHGRKVQDEPGFADGAFIVQDPATRHAVELLDIRPGERILDACAAPGGKSIQIAWRGAELTACEVNPKRRRRLEENLARTKLSDKVQIAGSLDSLPDGSFDKVLVDAPCSNTGVMRRRADARWNWSAKKVAELVALQREILAKAAAKCRRGGIVVYSTCSIDKEENEAQVKAFIASHPGAALAAERSSLPFASDDDGAYAAALRV